LTGCSSSRPVVVVVAVITSVAAPIKTAEGVVEAIRVLLANAPTVGLLA